MLPASDWSKISSTFLIWLSSYGLIHFCKSLWEISISIHMTKLSPSWDDYNLKMIQPPTYPDWYEGDRVMQCLRNNIEYMNMNRPKKISFTIPNPESSRNRAKKPLNKIGLLLCHSHIELRLRLRLSWDWYWGLRLIWGCHWNEVEMRSSRSLVEIELRLSWVGVELN